MTNEMSAAEQAVAHLQPEVWAKVNRHLVAKAIAELSHELSIRPELIGKNGGWSQYRIPASAGSVEYRFSARVMSLDHWHVDAPSIERLAADRGPGWDAVDAVTFMIDLRQELEIPEHVFPLYLQEIASTLYGAAYKECKPSLLSHEIACASFQEIETAMSEGHPIFIANNARIGFDASDYRVYAPEVASPVRLIWLAAHQSRAEFACTSDLSYAQLMSDELGAPALAAFARQLEERGLAAGEFIFLPVHPWQWQNRIAQLFAADIAQGDLVFLGPSSDRYLAQQSIRTLLNVSTPTRRYVKTALSILNMGFVRGMPPALASSMAPVNEWVSALVSGDDYLQKYGFSLLREVAFVGYRHRHYEKASNKRADPHKEMLSALWRDSPTSRLEQGQRLMTMAALMHVDSRGGSVLAELIRASGVGTDLWLDAYLACYLKPLLHCFYRHHLLFTPHCENVILVLEGTVPVAAIIKDITEDIGVTNPERPLPENVRRLALRVPEEVMTLGIFTDVFDCVFRFIAPILEQHMLYSEEQFWARVAHCIKDYQREQPQLAGKFQRYDLFAPTFIRNCLNRLQLRNNQQMVDLNAAEPVDSLQFAGTLPNPVARYAPEKPARGAQEVLHGAA